MTLGLALRSGQVVELPLSIVVRSAIPHGHEFADRFSYQLLER